MGEIQKSSFLLGMRATTLHNWNLPLLYCLSFIGIGMNCLLCGDPRLGFLARKPLLASVCLLGWVSKLFIIHWPHRDSRTRT